MEEQKEKKNSERKSFLAISTATIFTGLSLKRMEKEDRICLHSFKSKLIQGLVFEFTLYLIVGWFFQVGNQRQR